MINVSSCLPYMLRQRPVYYRERAARMYAPEAHGVAQLLVELPFTLLTVVVVLTPLYFMVGFSSNPEQYFF